jgi:FkbM family methyltransferase
MRRSTHARGLWGSYGVGWLDLSEAELRLPGELFHRFLESDEELDIIGSNEFDVVGAGTNSWRQPGAAELSEWQALLDAIEDARGRLTMIELGAGFGRFTVAAVAALRRYRPDLKHRFIAVEAEPTHYRWMKKHTRTNDLSRWSRAGSCKLIEAAVSREAGRDNFFVGKPREWYGQALVRPENETAPEQVTQVRTVTLSSLLESLDRVDLIDLDIQGAELEVLTEASPALGRVRRIHVETHSAEIDEKLPRVLEHARGNWHQELAVPLGATLTTARGVADFSGGGVQLWRNDVQA